jgi:CHASE2 domain-containing sensor protein
VPPWLTNAIELAVGAVCLVGSAIASRRRELRVIAIVLAIAGVAALGHATLMIANG